MFSPRLPSLPRRPHTHIHSSRFLPRVRKPRMSVAGQATRVLHRTPAVFCHSKRTSKTNRAGAWDRSITTNYSPAHLRRRLGTSGPALADRWACWLTPWLTDWPPFSTWSSPWLQATAGVHWSGGRLLVWCGPADKPCLLISQIPALRIHPSSQIWCRHPLHGFGAAAAAAGGGGYPEPWWPPDATPDTPVINSKHWLSPQVSQASEIHSRRSPNCV